MSLPSSSIMVRTAHPVPAARRRISELQEDGRSSQGGVKGLGVKHWRRFNTAGGERRRLSASPAQAGEG